MIDGTLVSGLIVSGLIVGAVGWGVLLSCRFVRIDDRLGRGQWCSVGE